MFYRICDGIEDGGNDEIGDEVLEIVALQIVFNKKPSYRVLIRSLLSYHRILLLIYLYNISYD